MTVTNSRIVTTTEEIDAAIAVSRAEPIISAVHAWYDKNSDMIAIRFEDDAEWHFPRKKMQGLTDASEDDLSQIELEAAGTIIHWPKVDVDHYIPGLLEGIFGTRKYMQQLGRAGGSKTSEAKRTAARENGKKGGRKRKKAAR